MRIKYIADDGTEFDDEIACEYYEWKMNHPHLKDVHIFNKDGIEFTDIFSQDTYEYSDKIVVTSIDAVKTFQDFAEYTGYNSYADIIDVGEWVFDMREGEFIKVNKEV